ncbi:MAG: hypothetical protein H6624_20020 [Bdellovibrionaceae bacterium]|nr:hypothetical protein [Pseudobdellovibrionaceae bacterium]
MSNRFVRVLVAVFLAVVILSSQDTYGAETKGKDRLEKELEKLNSRYWGGKIPVGRVKVVEAGNYDVDLVAMDVFELKRNSIGVILCKDAEVRFVRSEIWHINTKSAGCKVGEYEAAAGTTISFWETETNRLRSLVIAKSMKVRGYTWPANSNLLFGYGPDPLGYLYAVELGADLEGTKFKKGQRVYVGEIIDDTGKRDDKLSLEGDEHHL